MRTSASLTRLRAVILDTGPLGLLCNPKATTNNIACRTWAADLATAGVRLIVPEIADYELRRELLQAGLTKSLKTLDELIAAMDYLPLTTGMMHQAAALWAQSRRAGRPTADRHALDGDAILAAQILSLGYTPDTYAVATTNLGHLTYFVTADLWQNIQG